jgi:hypothetical protein
MQEKTWRRDAPHWHNVAQAPWESLPGPRIAGGVEGRLISRGDDADGSATMMLRLPPGWTFARAPEPGALELFIVAGGMIVEGEQLGVGGFIGIPPGSGTVELGSDTGADLIVFWNPQFRSGDCYPDGQLRVVRTWREEWIPVEVPELPHGVFFKPLRIPYFSEAGFGGVAGNLTLVASLPSMHTEDAEHHEETWEELVCLTGDTFFPGRGSGGPGTVINNPAYFEHGPFGTQRGHIALMHALRPLRIIRAHLPGGPETMEYYLDTEPMLAEPLRTEQWSELSYAQAMSRFAAAKAGAG